MKSRRLLSFVLVLAMLMAVPATYIEAAGTVYSKVISYNNTYSAAGAASGSFKANTNASNILSAFSSSYGTKLLNHPNGIASDGKKFVVCDTWNNRVLIYNSLPTANTAPSVVIGQKNFKTYKAGSGLNQLNFPVSATISGGKLLVADTNNNRILVYNKIPTTNGCSANAEITMADSGNSLFWPWAVWTNGNKLVVTSTQNGRVVFWNSLDNAISGSYADFVIDTKGTPRTILSNGKFLLIGDHNVNGSSEYGSYVWTSFPTSSSSKPNFTLDEQLGGGFIGKNLYTISNMGYYEIWNGVIDSKGEVPAQKFRPSGSATKYMQTGDVNQIVYAGKKTYVSYYNSCYVAIYDGRITKKNYQNPVGYIGSSKKTTTTTYPHGMYQNPVTATDGKSLAVVDDYNQMLYIYKKIPNTNYARADYAYYFNDPNEYPIDIKIDSKGKMFVLTEKSLLIWNTVPTKGQAYNNRYLFGQPIGKNNASIAVNDSFIYIASEYKNTLYKFKKTQTNFGLSRSVSRTSVRNGARGLYANNKYVLISKDNEGCVVVKNAGDLKTYKKITSNSPNDHLNQPSDAILLDDGKLVIADSSNNRVLLYGSIEKAASNFASYIEIGGMDKYPLSQMQNNLENTVYPALCTNNTMNRPSSLCYANGHLWVGEYKFSSRILRFDKQ